MLKIPDEIINNLKERLWKFACDSTADSTYFSHIYEEGDYDLDVSFDIGIHRSEVMQGDSETPPCGGGVEEISIFSHAVQAWNIDGKVDCDFHPDRIQGEGIYI